MTSKKRKPGKAQQRVDAIYAELLDRIRLLHYLPGTRLSEVELAEEFGVSRTPIRRVLQRLEFENLAERTQGSYTTVTDYDLDEMIDVYELRMVLAESMDKLSAKPLSPRGIQQLETLLERAQALYDRQDLEELGRIHYDFQEQLADCVKNAYARQLIIQTYNQIARIWLQRIPRLDWNEELRIFCDELATALQAMRAGDVRTVGLIRRNHIAMNLHRMRQLQREEAQAQEEAEALAV